MLGPEGIANFKGLERRFFSDSVQGSDSVLTLVIETLLSDVRVSISLTPCLIKKENSLVDVSAEKFNMKSMGLSEKSSIAIVQSVESGMGPLLEPEHLLIRRHFHGPRARIKFRSIGHPIG